MVENNEKIDFGFKQVDKEQKQAMVHDVFASVASKYDIMNDLMSGGLHRLWKDKFVNQIRLHDDCKLLDLAGGTGDISFRFLNRAKKFSLNAHATLTDINENMLHEGRNRAIDKGLVKNIEFNIVDAQEIPYPDNEFDFCTIAFGIRNVTDRAKALGEIHRILKPGGQFLCLEFSHIDNKILSKIYDNFSFNLVPKMGQMIAGDSESYQYLVESIRKFPSRDEFAAMIENADFKQVKYQTLNQGIVAIHSGWKI